MTPTKSPYKLRVDPELKSFLPSLSPGEREALEASLKSTGRAVAPIVTWRGTILDGHNRYEICTAHSIPYETIELPLETKDDAKQWMIDHQLARRNWSLEQQAAFVALHGAQMPPQLRGTTLASKALELAQTDEGRTFLHDVLHGRARYTIRGLAQQAAMASRVARPPSGTRLSRADQAVNHLRLEKSSERRVNAVATMYYELTPEEQSAVVDVLAQRRERDVTTQG